MEENKPSVETPPEQQEIENLPESIEQPSAEEAQPKSEPLAEVPHSVNGLVIGIALGMVAGIVLGFLLKQIPVWIVGGILLGGAIGYLLDLRVDRRRKEADFSDKE